MKGDKEIVKVRLNLGKVKPDTIEEERRIFCNLDDLTYNNYVAISLVDDTEYSKLYTSENYILLKIYSVDSRKFERSDFLANSGACPILLGSNYKEKYALGGEYTIDSGNGLDIRVKVVRVCKSDYVFKLFN